jgi:uncharacterized protein YecT (DUF1311 family)
MTDLKGENMKSTLSFIVPWHRIIAVFLGSFLFLSAVAASMAPPQKSTGAKHPIDTWLEACTAKDQSTAGQIACLGQAYEKWDAELNRVYKELTAKLPEAGRPVLRTAQLAWLKFRDEEFKLLDALYDPLDGSMYRLMKTADRVDLIRKRALEIASYLDVLDNI